MYGKNIFIEKLTGNVCETVTKWGEEEDGGNGCGVRERVLIVWCWFCPPLKLLFFFISLMVYYQPSCTSLFPLSHYAGCHQDHCKEESLWMDNGEPTNHLDFQL